MQSKKTLLQCLVVTEIVLIAAAIVADSVLEHTLPPEFQQYVARTEDEPMTARQAVGFGFAILFLLSLLVAWVGLWKLWRPARLIYTVSWLASLPILLLFDSVVYSTSLSEVLNVASNLVAGAILSLLYFSELASHFSRSGPVTAPHPGV